MNGRVLFFPCLQNIRGNFYRVSIKIYKAEVFLVYAAL